MVIDKSVKILLVEDDPDDVDLIKETLKKSTLLMEIAVVEDGEKALALLRQEPPYTTAHKPDLIILDLNLPRKTGREVLQEIKDDNRMKSIPVIVLSTSSAEEEIQRAYETGCNCYVTKPLGLDNFSKTLRLIEEFWISTAKLPFKAFS